MRIPKQLKLAARWVLAAFLTVPAAGGLPAAYAAAEKFPTYVQQATVPGLASGKADIAGSAFVDKDGEFHWMYSVANYEQSDSGGSWIKSNTHTDLGALNTDWGAATTYNSYWNRPGTINYKLDETYGIPTPYQDDHNDGIGVWIDPDTGYWYALTNDEYQFNPFAAGNPTTNERIASGLHNNRVLAAYSTDKGSTWKLIGQVATSPWNDGNEAATASNFPGSTWSYGVAGTRFFVDNVNGYFYVLYNNHINWKPGYSNILTYFSLARSPISAKMAEGSWDVWYNGTWTRSALKGYAGWIGSPMGAGSDHNLTVNYIPETDSLTLTGTGMDGSPLDISYEKIPSGGVFTFKDAAGSAYTANTVSGTIKNANGDSVPSVSYSDPALDAAVTVSVDGGKISIKQENNSTGYLASVTPGGSTPIFKNTATQRLFVPVNTQYENAFSFNVYSGKYRSVGYDGYVYETDDLGAPDTFKIVGKLPATVGSYLSQIDTGSLTNQQVSGYSFRTISDLSGKQINYSIADPGPGQTYYSAYNPPKDQDDAAITPSAAYTLSIGGHALKDGLSDRWQFIPVPDEFDPSKPSGFYRLQNVDTGMVLKVSGTSAATTRAMGAAVISGAPDADADPGANGGNGAAAGSDQWYLLPVGNAAPAYLTPASSSSVIAAATNTSLSGIAQYRLVNRASALGVEFVAGQAALQGMKFGAGNPQVVTIAPAASNLPSAPTGLTAAPASMSQINVSWNASAGAAGYDLLVDGAVVGGVSSPYAHMGLAANSAHTYQVRATNSAGAGIWSVPVSAATRSGIVSQGKTATASSVQAGNAVSNANDGNAATRWAAVTNSYPQWWKVDLGSSMNITKLESYWYNSTTYPRSYRYIIEGSNDDATYTTILDRTGNTTQGLTTDSFDETYRYVRVTVTGSSYSGGSASCYEFIVYGDEGRQDLTAPQTTAVIAPSGSEGLNGWYVKPVTVSLQAEDDLSGVQSTEYTINNEAEWTAYRDPLTFSQDGTYHVFYKSSDAAGNAEAVKELTVNLDTAPPNIDIASTVTDSVYVSDASAATFQVSVQDNLSGVQENGALIQLDGRNVQSLDNIEMFALPLGEHLFTVHAADSAGNESIKSVSFKTAASRESIQALIGKFVDKGWIKANGTSDSLSHKLDRDDLSGFIQFVKAQQGKHISSEAASYLIRDAEALLHEMN
ncbi:discoidin domain-containing protein [Paenibacillus doosanensis]|uniref:OmpL47-type beta-barrel domain-containing protein n=1 Tax=Paenibacillus doosanensis TaxID=1229154 RepID=UPI0021807C98|nr:discoidin domain-containing protein [Paenibacillus doosanensis]MCS7462335.1 discoidin domain-containing protein [Paenibacillus doosanensis]